jgi:hypothetical protein
MPRNGSGVYSLPAGSTFTPNTLIQSSVVNGINTDLTTDANTPRPIVAGGTGASSAAGARAALGLTTGTFFFMYGLTLSNNAGDAANSIDIATGTAAEQGVAAPNLMSLPSILSKSVAVAWTVGGTPGSPAGGLDTGVVSNANYHVWLIQRSDTGVVDALFSLSGTAPTMPTSYDRKRRLGIIIRLAGSNLAFRQYNRRFMLSAVSTTRSSTSAASNVQLLFLSTNGVRVRPIFNSSIIAAASTSASNQFADGDAAAVLTTVNLVNNGAASGIDVTVIDGPFVTDTSGNLRYTANVGGAITSNTINLIGWYDDIQV